MQDLAADLRARHRPGVLLVTHDVEEGGQAFDALRDRLLAELGVHREAAAAG
jgi:ABC-type nitrate/sulfonate/bicarbonate transport system ATPase subunit